MVGTDPWGYVKALITVSLRSPEVTCSSMMQRFTMGDRLVVNADKLSYALPINATAAASAGWVKGSCFSGMGTHWFRDLRQKGKLGFPMPSESMWPVVTMYDGPEGPPDGGNG